MVKHEDLTVSAIRHLQSMMRDVGYLEAKLLRLLDGLARPLGTSRGQELISNGTKTKLYFVFQKLWHSVVPSTGFLVKDICRHG